ncbi:MAG TPA: type III pantothenate kinase [Spirochaetales bacterium]|nr:type III pantothenate kinase [Spirochaetales bacterium]HRY54948.1 type III pantothenate kinase [Spirochaetia bacterium]
MLLAIDARNRAVRVGFRDAGGWKALRAFGAYHDRSPDEYAHLLCLAAAEASGSAPGVFAAEGGLVGEAWISSVVPALTQKLAAAAETAFGVKASIVGPGVKSGVRIRTDNPSEVGSDLVCAAAAARELAGGACVVVDFGAVLTVSAIDASGDFLGAAIAPGLESAAHALRAAAAQLPEVRLEIPRRAIGKNTSQSVQAGVVLGYEGLVARLVQLMREEIASAGAPAEAIPVIGTGEAIGEAMLSRTRLGRFVPDLALEGIALIAGRA